jgi:hypothetical protein
VLAGFHRDVIAAIEEHQRPVLRIHQFDDVAAVGVLGHHGLRP